MRLSSKKLLKKLTNVTGMLCQSMKFEKTRNDVLRMHKFYSSPTSSIFFIEDGENLDPLNIGSYNQFALYMGHSMYKTRSSSGCISRFLWVSPNDHCKDQFLFDVGEMKCQSEFKDIRKIL